ncbi:VOC family protein, partial [Nocardia sp. NPDC060220]|uniref:VOC family protein n=1 Tax=Nocardia sp. NPDC060220 TaxID=3347076 RepID=UPI0036626260
ARWATPDFAEIVTPAGTLAIGSVRTVALFGAGSARPADNRTAIIEFMVSDVDADYRRLRDSVEDFVNEPTTMPWGNRSLLLRDPDGNLINLFTPITAQAAG